MTDSFHLQTGNETMNIRSNLWVSFFKSCILCGRSKCPGPLQQREYQVHIQAAALSKEMFNPQQLYSPFTDETFFFRAASIS